ncbi:MAG: COX15/CtaA family protein [Gemmatimonadaceae bacterium]
MSLVSTGAPPVLTNRSSVRAIELVSHRSHQLIRVWMFASAVSVILTLVVGGVTRLTESGLSITEWKPVSGILPPLSEAEWRTAYQSYLQIPEAQTVHRGITRSEFQTLFWWEWLHRFVARMAGLVIALPYLLLLVGRRIPRPLHMRLLALPVLTAVQGALGWYMVQSGLSGRTDVSQYRLVAHLGLALCIYVITVWTALTVGVRRLSDAHATLHWGALAVAAMTFVTILSGGFVAGLDAGHIYNTFPLMGSGLVPREYSDLAPVWRNWFENPAAVQFNHRVLALCTLLLAGVAYARERWTRTDLPAAWNAVLLAVVVQIGLGVFTLRLGVPVPVAALHQLGAVALLTAALWAACWMPLDQSSSTTP